MIINETDIRRDSVLAVGRMMMTAARTAPKARGVDIAQITMVWGDDLPRLAGTMRQVGEQTGMQFFLRDAVSVEQCQAVILIGAREQVLGLNCGLCGYPDCAAKGAERDAAPCYFNGVDLGIALGSAVSLAADHRVDTRIMYSAGMSAKQMGLVGDCGAVLAIVLSCSSKSPFFDRVFP